MLSPAVDNLVAQLTKLPGVGQRTAQRLAFHLLQVFGQCIDQLSRGEALGGRREIRDIREEEREGSDLTAQAGGS